MSLRQLLVVLLCCRIVGVDSTFYGNEIKERATSGYDSNISPAEPRIWIDDPLNGDSWPHWGYLKSYDVYIHAFTSSVPRLSRLQLQIWSNTTQINNYTLKWQKNLENYETGTIENYETGTIYKVSPDDGQVVEVTEYDRIGFTNEGNNSAIALDLETDDAATASTAHRTYFRPLRRDNYALPVVGDYRYVDNNALRGRFSIGVTLDNAPPRKATEVFLGHDLSRRNQNSSLYSSSGVDDSVALVSGKLTAFYFRLTNLTTATTIELQIWQKSTGMNYILTYIKSVSVGPSPEKTHNVSINDGPVVNSSHRFGVKIPQYLFYSPNFTSNCYQLLSDDQPLQVGKSYTFNGLAWNFEASFGVIIDQQPIAGPSSSSSSSTSTRVSATSSSTTSSRATSSSTSSSSTSSSRATSSSSSTASSSSGSSTKLPTPGPLTSTPSSGGDGKTTTTSLFRTSDSGDNSSDNSTSRESPSNSGAKSGSTTWLYGSGVLLIWCHIFRVVTLQLHASRCC